MAKTYDIKITSAIAIGGKIIPAGEIVAVDERTAKNLLHRGKGELPQGGADPRRKAGPISTQAAPGDEKPLAEHTVAELKEIAAELEIEGADGMKKAELIEAIEANEAGEGT